MERSYYDMEYQVRERVSNYQMQAQHNREVQEGRDNNQGIRQMIGRIMINVGQRVAGQPEVVSEVS